MYRALIYRTIHTSKSNFLRSAAKRGANPGAAYQLKAVESTDEMTQDFADMESDFMEVHKSHKQHESELQMIRDKTRLAVVKQKYFKEKLPNFLTYAEKEQIKLLHQRDNEEWTIDKLAESFPASSDIIRKIIRANWKPRSKERVHQHDESVVKNWELLQKGSISGLHPEYVEHLKLFSSRINRHLLQKPLNEKKSFKPTIELPKPKNQEFVSIVTSCEKYKDIQSKQKALTMLKSGKTKFESNSNRPEDTYLTDKIQDKRSMRLQELKKLKLNPNISSPEVRAYESVSNPNGTGLLYNNEETLGTSSASKNSDSHLNLINKIHSSEIVISSEDRKRYEMSTAKDRIYIPKKLYQKGATYKVEDYYYDDDGEFLYRVPGMIGKQKSSK